MFMDSDSDMHSDEEEGDQVEVLDPFRDSEQVLVQGAGLRAVNGVYKRVGTSENVGKYSKAADWQGQNHAFSLFRCGYWYISIVPMGVLPGSSMDIDFYSARLSDKDTDLPPSMGWTKSCKGQNPPPLVTVQYFLDVAGALCSELLPQKTVEVKKEFTRKFSSLKNLAMSSLSAAIMSLSSRTGIFSQRRRRTSTLLSAAYGKKMRLGSGRRHIHPR